MGKLRLSKHPLVRWWWSLDRTTFLSVLGLMIFGSMLMMSASIAVSQEYSVSAYYFAKKQAIFLFLGLGSMLFFSLMTIKGIRNMGFLLFAVALVGVVATLLVGADVKGAKRWIDMGFFSLQPSELLKPSFAIVSAFILSRDWSHSPYKGIIISGSVLGVIGVLLLLQPDFGMAVMLGLVWFTQVVISGAPMLAVVGLMAAAPIGVSAVYFMLPHVKSRIDRFLDPASGDSYQVDQAFDAFTSGGFFGRGPGEGVVKYHLPDAHTDFIFAVIAEELGILFCLVLLSVYIFLTLRGCGRLVQLSDKFAVVAGGSLLVLFSLQALVNVSVALSIMPTTGMTLPFISYGGSSTLALSIVIGFILALTRRRGSLYKNKQVETKN